ncbi:MAG: heavy-metal-associated domain-containing protein [Candidatus Hodarchaeales archaeon]|jgi:Cu+-exporting ATPase
MAAKKPFTKEIDIAYLKILGLASLPEAQTIEDMLLKIDGVQKVSINLVEAKARVNYDPTRIVIETLIESVEDIGFGALDLVKSRPNIREFSFRVIGICGKCLETFVKILKRKNGIIDVKGDLDINRVQVKFNNKKISTKEIKDSFFDFEHQRVM